MANDYRSEFPVTKAWAYLNHANVAPLSRRAQIRLAEWSDDVAMNGDTTIEKWFEEIESVRRGVARVLSAEPREIAFLKNTSEGISLVAEGFPWQHGDNVLIVSGDYPANVYPWLHLSSKGVQVTIVVPKGDGIDVGDIAKAVDSRTRLVSVSYVQFDTGFRADLGSIGEFCRRRGIDFCVDGIQGVGVFPINVKEMGIDYLCANSQKWLVSPQGAAMFYIDEAKRERLRPTSVGWKSVVSPHDYSRIDFRFAGDAKRFECGSFIVPSIISLGGSLSLFEEVSLPVIRDRVKRTTDYLVERLRVIGANIISRRDPSHWSGIVSFELNGKRPSVVVQQCRDAGVAISCRASCLRASPHFYNNQEDIDRLIEAIRAK